MAKTREGRTDIAVAIVALTAEAAELETRVTELRKELMDVDRRMTAVSAALYRLSPA
ncbi:hypothetical protein ACIRPU_18935 [Streptomyces sp. NPDC102259]|uniref:hypothetical protein n=1 Tax=Streptomyces sp. NPDC102259 TaxID=3366148 RepID=UPI0038190993